jgi:prophage regulatory protein
MREMTQVPITLLRCKSVQERTGLVRSAIYRQITDGDFPKPIKITAKAVAWPSNEIDNWILSRIEGGHRSFEGQKFVDASVDDKLKLCHRPRKQPCPETALKNQPKK